MLTVIGNYIKWCPNKPQSKFALYHLTKCCGKRGQAEQLSINKNVRKYRRCAYVCLPSSCLRAACVCVMNVCKCECTRATWHPFKIRMCSESGQQSGRRKHFRWENMPKIHFNNNSNFSLTYQNTITNTNAILHLELVDFGHFRYGRNGHCNRLNFLCSGVGYCKLPNAIILWLFRPNKMYMKHHSTGGVTHRVVRIFDFSFAQFVL